ncbi:hypothetical protein [Hespellia stercorisuis]|uniref:Uncharacterized protein n=1 Tax=Hespellia stercorisuis DSM 15480 TaxID=1121950 RepID=A0A1M6WJZ9_9FIRM|nr:hypothetical protein [Hespellia stercorisuis]SHK93845.1 hypothetical protein SAMN02745243_04032 [Hespellia stercorisuis DSM 15480]
MRKLIQLVWKKVQKGQSCAEIADALEEEEAYIERLVTAVGHYASEYNEDAIYEELSGNADRL